MVQVQTRTVKAIPEWAVYAVGALPALYLAYAALTGGLGFDVARALEKELGITALQFLLIGLAITPLWRLTGLNLSKYKRATGLIAFAYAVLHLAAYVLLDNQLDWALIIEDIWKRPYITIGMLAFLLLVPLAATSNAAMVKRLGAASWKALHRLAYAIAPLAALHFVMLTKTWQAEPLIYLAIALAMLALRHPMFDWRARPARAARVAAMSPQAGSLAP
ncbi:MAG: protein-methionine-sulfoxide reductase heme-binding subunit MsrQ [Rhizobiaceae bacterium]|nr:protein-methionine-sulfoxide reductase heme-binding subunit MsrQ [Rhizobiaceae bacterium]